MAFIIYLILLKVQESVANKTTQSLSNIDSPHVISVCKMPSSDRARVFNSHSLKIGLVLGAAALIASCSSPQKTTTRIDKKEVSTNQVATTTPQTSAKDYLQIAKEADSTAIVNLVLAANAYFEEKKYVKAIALSRETLALIKALNVESGISFGYANGAYELNVVQAQAYLALEQIEKAAEMLTHSESIAKKNKLAHSLSYYQTLANASAAQAKAVISIDAQLRVKALQAKSPENGSINNAETLADESLLWEQLVALSTWEVEQLAKMAAPNVKGWVSLINRAHRIGLEQVAFTEYLKAWQQKNPSHPASAIANSIAKNELIESTTENIAVLLPLSGRQMKAGNAAAQGILAAYGNDQSKTLHFIDTQTLDFSTLANTFLELNIDLTVGPLLKSKVTEYLSIAELTVPTILLNTSSNEALLPYQVAFSMKPEDEAVQAASVLSEKNFKSPLILSHKDSVSDRITNTFVTQWQKLTGDTPEIIHFERGQTMQREVTTSLGVTDSKARIKDLETRLKQTIKTESRNRRDIDMIYIVGSPIQTRLVKPYIDVNISPFSDLVPIYASSRSHSINVDASENRDLEGLIFTEMPWLLTSKQRNTALVEQSMSLWPKRSDSLQRIFAMGYDSYSILEKLPTMKSTPYVRHYGQTGILQLDDNNLITRSLLWGRYHKDRVEEIAMD